MAIFIKITRHWIQLSSSADPFLSLRKSSPWAPECQCPTWSWGGFLRRVRRLEKEQCLSGRAVFWLFPCHSSGWRFFRIILAHYARILTSTHRFSGSPLYPSSSHVVHWNQSYRAAGVSRKLSLALRWARHRIADLSFLFCTLSWQWGLMKSWAEQLWREVRRCLLHLP